MPLDFPDMHSLANYFGGGLPPRDGETEAEYRERCAVWSEEHGDIIQATEVRAKKGWDKWHHEKKILAQEPQEAVSDFSLLAHAIMNPTKDDQACTGSSKPSMETLVQGCLSSLADIQKALEKSPVVDPPVVKILQRAEGLLCDVVEELERRTT